MTPPLPPPQPPKRRTGLVVGLAVALAVAVALIVALLVTGSDDGDVVTEQTDDLPGENQDVVVDGKQLPPLPEPGDDDEAIGLEPPLLQGFSFDRSPVNVEPGGTPKMVVFLAHWCPHCNAEIPRLIEWKESGQMPEGLELIGVSTGTRPDGPNYPPSAWLDAKGWPWPAMADSETAAAATAYGLTSYPYFVVIGADGTVKVRFSGEIEVEQLDGLVRTALAD